MNELQDSVRSLVQTVIATSGLDIALSDDLSLIQSGLLDSLKVVGLVQRLQELFDIELEFSDITLENFDSISAIISFVANRQSA